MDEAAIAAQLMQGVPGENPSVDDRPIIPETPRETDGTIIPPTQLDDLTIWKLHDFFGEQYQSSNIQSKTKLQFIYDNVAQQIGTRDYLSVVSRIAEIERMVGSAHSGNRIARIYQWVGLDNVRKNAEKAMRLLNV